MVTFALGLVLGVVLGVVLGPVIQFVIARAEWRDATGELRMTDRLLDQIIGEADREGTGPDSDRSVRPGVLNGRHR